MKENKKTLGLSAFVDILTLSGHVKIYLSEIPHELSEREKLMLFYAESVEVAIKRELERISISTRELKAAVTVLVKKGRVKKGEIKIGS